MKYLFFLFFLCTLSFSQEKVRVAVLPFTGVKAKEGELLATILSQSLARNGLIEPLVRNGSEITKIMNEFKFQAKGITDDQKKARLGAALNTKYIISGELQSFGKNIILSVSVFDVETLTTKAGDSKILKAIDEAPHIIPEIAADISPIMAMAEGGTSIQIILAKRAGQKGISDIQALLLRGVNAGNSINKTPLMFAAENGYEDLAFALLNEEAAVDIRDKDRKTALIYASSKGYTDIVELLIRNGADINAISENGATALMYACQDGHRNTVAKLLAYRADPNIKTPDGISALALAYSNDHPQIIKLLKSAKAKQ